MSLLLSVKIHSRSEIVTSNTFPFLTDSDLCFLCWASDTEVINSLLILMQHHILISLCFGAQVDGPGGPREDS